MRCSRLLFATLFSLFVPLSPGWAVPTTDSTVTSTQCGPAGPTITLTMNSPGAGNWLLSPGPGTYLFFDGAGPSVYWSPGTGTPHNPGTFPAPNTPGPHTVFVAHTNNLPSTGSGPYTFTTPNCGTAATKGMTWVHLISNAATGTITVGCNSSSPTDSCNAHTGDTACTALRPMLCIYGGKPLQTFSVPAGVSNSDQYNKWSGGVVATTAPVQGSSFQHRTDADARCAADFGLGWRMAEFHDGWGWNFQAYGGTVGAPAVGVTPPTWHLPCA